VKDLGVVTSFLSAGEVVACYLMRRVVNGLEIPEIGAINRYAFGFA
jgi:hypothetical protein